MRFLVRSFVVVACFGLVSPSAPNAKVAVEHVPEDQPCREVVYRLIYADANFAVKELNGMIGKTSNVTIEVDRETHTFVLRGNRAAIDAVVTCLDQLEEEFSERGIFILRLKDGYVSPVEHLLPFIVALPPFSNEEEYFKFTVDHRTNSLILAGRKRSRRQLETILRSFGALKP